MTDAFNPGFPIHIYEPGMELPKQGTYYLVAGNGMWLHKDTGIVKAFVPVENISVLEDLEADVYVECSLPKLPLRLVWRIKEFFRRVVEKHHAEAATTLYYRKSDESFKIHIPQQRVTHGGVNYERCGLSHVEGMEDYLRVGTIHSHCDFGAFHSGTDVHDEEDFDGLHCTFGHNNKEVFTISASVVVNGIRNQVDPADVLEGIELRKGDSEYAIIGVSEEEKAEWAADLDEWMSQVTGSGTPSFWGWSSKKEERGLQAGDQVAWAGDLKLVSFRTVCGDGPFEVVSVRQGKITVITNVGLAEFDQKLFRRHTE